MSKVFKNSYVTIGLMLFALFFGAGNLIFPAFLGAYSGSNVWLSVLGFCVTGVTLPLLGVVAVSYSGATDVSDFAGRVSKKFGVVYAVALYLSIGVLFAIPRTGATSYEVGVEPIFGSSLLVKVIYAVVFFGLTYFLAMNPSKIADRVGKYLTPLLILVLVVLVVASFFKATPGYGEPLNAAKDAANAFSGGPLVAGLLQGYGTMDTLASLAFAIIVINAAKFSVVLLALVYIFVARIGAISQNLFELNDKGLLTHAGKVVSGGTILSVTSHYFIGNVGQVVLALVIFLACLTTSTGLVTACSEYFQRLVPKVSHKVWATIFTLGSTALYFNGLTVIINWSVPVLYLLYPLTIALVFITFLAKTFGDRKEVYLTTTVFTFVPALYDSVSTFTAMTKWFELPKSVVHFFTKVVPLGSYSMGWVPFAVLGFLVGFVYVKVFKKERSKQLVSASN